jgi:hypothetical protein
VTPTYDLGLLGVFVEPRGVFGSRDALVNWFLGARVAFVHREIYTLNTSGVAFGGIMGLLIGPSWPVRIEPAITATYLTFYPYIETGDWDTGSAVGLQVGISVPID